MEFLKAIGDSMSGLTDSVWFKAGMPLLTLFLGWYAKRLIDWFRWSRRQFLHRMIVSLNSIEDGRLLIRTVFEKSVDEVFLNSHAVNIVTKAAQATNNENPLLDLPKEESWHILNSVLNAVAEEFKEGVVRRDMGLPVRSANYIICLTHEVADDIKQDKIRVMMIRDDLLASLPTKPPALEKPHHALRLKTLSKMHEYTTKRPDLFMKVEVCIAADVTEVQPSLPPDAGTI